MTFAINGYASQLEPAQQLVQQVRIKKHHHRAKAITLTLIDYGGRPVYGGNSGCIKQKCEGKRVKSFTEFGDFSLVDPVGDSGYLKLEGNSGGVSTGVIGPGGFNTKSLDCPTSNSRRGGVGSACYNCGECGHYARDCPTGNSRRSGGSGCYTCGGVDK
nr:hypothetical protein [Tanacetum cinerariifolium]